MHGVLSNGRWWWWWRPRAVALSKKKIPCGSSGPPLLVLPLLISVLVVSRRHYYHYKYYTCSIALAGHVHEESHFRNQTPSFLYSHPFSREIVEANRLKKKWRNRILRNKTSPSFFQWGASNPNLGPNSQSCSLVRKLRGVMDSFWRGFSRSVSEKRKLIPPGHVDKFSKGIRSSNWHLSFTWDLQSKLRRHHTVVDSTDLSSKNWPAQMSLTYMDRSWRIVNHSFGLDQVDGRYWFSMNSFQFSSPFFPLHENLFGVFAIILFLSFPDREVKSSVFWNCSPLLDNGKWNSKIGDEKARSVLFFSIDRRLPVIEHHHAPAITHFIPSEGNCSN